MSFPWEGKHDFAKPLQRRKGPSRSKPRKAGHPPIDWTAKSTTPKDGLKKVKRPRAASGKKLASKNSDITVINLVTGEVTVEENTVRDRGNRKRSR
jgi:hypothetical protein